MVVQRLRVLLVEDEPGDATLVLHALKASRVPSFAVIHEATLAEAIERIGMSAAFDVVLLDLNLPDSTGLETLSRMLEAESSLPIVIMTGFDDPVFAEQALDAGAQDYLVKSETSERMVVRSIRYAVSRKLADLERKAMADRLHDSLAAEFERMNADLSLARSMQFDLLPRHHRLEGYLPSHGLAVDGFFEPSFDVGGDLWGCATGGGGQAVFYTFDFSGHGVCAALNVFRLHALLSELDGHITDPAATLGRLNTILFSLLPRGQYATIFLCLIDAEAGTLTWSAGGAPRPILVDRAGVVQWLDTRGRPLGISGSAQYLNRVVPFPPDSSLFLYSDVMTESVLDGGDMLEEDGLLGMVHECHSADGIDLAKLVGRFIDTVGSPMDDDMTAVCITRAARPQTLPVMPEAIGQGEPPLSPSPLGGRHAPGPAMLVSRRLEAIAIGLSRPYNGFIEIAAAGLDDLGPSCLDAGERGGFGLSLTAASAWSCDVAGLVSAAIRQRFAGDRDWDGIDICLSEALGNAIVHGSLGIKSSLRETRSGLERYSEALCLGLSDPARAGKRVEVTVIPLQDGRLEIAVYDQGDGFDFERRGRVAIPRDAKHGRGLSLIRKTAGSVTSSDGGRTLIMTI